MESSRYLRIALPPFVFYGAVILAHALNGTLVTIIKGWGEAKMVIATIIGASIVPVGFLIGGITLLVLSYAGKREWVGRGRYDLLYESSNTEPLLDDLNVEKPGSADDHLNAARTFVYEARERWWLADYLNRLWDASMAYFGSMIAMFIAVIYFFAVVTPKCWWWLLIAGVMFLVFWRAWYIAREEIENVVTFQIKHKSSISQAVAQWKPQEAARPGSGRGQ